MSTVVKDLGAVSAYAYAVEKGYTGTEAEFAELMADYAEVGQRAEDAADSALESKTAAQTAATTATNKASEATTAATTATTKAAEAQADADAAALDASQAMSAASTATTKATEATTAAATAVSAKDDAVSANTAAQSAKTAAQTAQTGAETAAASVSASAAQIATNAEDISQLKSEFTALTNESNESVCDIAYNKEQINIPLIWTVGGINSGNGSETDNTSYRRTGFIEVPQGQTIYITFPVGIRVYGNSYNTDKSFIYATQMNESGQFSFTGDRLVRFSLMALSGYEIPTDINSVVHVSFGNVVKSKLDNVETALRSVSYGIANGSNLTNHYYINTNDGSAVYSEAWVCSEYIDVSGISHIVTTMATFSSTVNAGLAFYDSNREYVSGVAGRVTGTAGYETVIVDVPTDAKYIRFSFRTSDLSAFFAKVDEAYVLQHELDENKTSTFFGMQMFEKIGVISDSISCGWARDKNGNNSRRNTGISWVQQMARRLGCTAYNLGASGVDPIEWFQSDFEFAQYCLPQYQSVGECDLYIIGLGLNGGTLGSTSDINQSDYTQNGSTFYGQYARIIQMINAEHPNAIVMCLTEPTTRVSSYDQAVRNICALSYINAELVDLEHDYFDLFNTPEILAEHQPDELHFTPYGYSLLADAMVKALSDYISKNPTAFKYVGVATV